MASLKIVCVTWNLELEEPEGGPLATFFAGILKQAGDADLIAVGIQEGGSLTKYRQILEKAIPGYVCVTKMKFKGVTKWTQIFTQSAAQGLYILVKGKAEEKEELKEDANAESEKGTKKLFSEKGYCYSEVTLDKHRIGFISTHAEVKEEKRGADFKAIEEFLKGKAKGAPFHALFMMGDMNYRISRTAKDKDEKALASEAEQIYKDMTTQAGRQKLMQLDTFDEKTLGASLPWVWAPPSKLCFPTYKRQKLKEAKPLVAKLAGDPEPADLQTLKELYKVKRSEKGPFWDFGWLDRIAIACGKKAGDTLDVGLKLAKPPELRSGHWLAGGDHVPVYAIYQLDG